MRPVSSITPRPPSPQNPDFGHLDDDNTGPLDYDSDDPSIPREFICPITHGLMRHPVCMADGSTCEAQAAQDYFDFNAHRVHLRGPLTNKRLAHREVVPNLALIAIGEQHFPRAAALRRQRIAQERTAPPATFLPRLPGAQAPEAFAPPAGAAPLAPAPAGHRVGDGGLIGAALGLACGALGGLKVGLFLRDFLGLDEALRFEYAFASAAVAWCGTLGGIWFDRLEAGDRLTALHVRQILTRPMRYLGPCVLVAVVVGLMGLGFDQQLGTDERVASLVCLWNKRTLGCLPSHARNAAVLMSSVGFFVVIVATASNLQGLLARD